MSNILVVAEVRAGKLKRPSLEAITAAQQLAAKTGGKVIALAIGSFLDAAGKELAATAHEVVLADTPEFAAFSGDAYARVVTEQVKAHAASAVLMAHTAMGKDLLPRVAAHLDTGLITDAVEVTYEGGKFSAQKPVFAGKAMLKVNATRQPFMATLRPNNFTAATSGGAGQSPQKISPAANDLMSVVKEILASGSDKVPLQEAKVIVAGGRGLKEPQHFKLIEDLAAAFGPSVAAVAATRAVVDAGWRPHSEQVGQTGKVVSSTLYFAIGISGAIQHLAGMRTARTIVAINKDADAPIFKVADYGIVGDAFEIVPALIAAVKAVTANH
ncbi:electron transfer flavoprotein subunit alpha [Planctomycetota bacterium]|jgi:electron transfer flavoprotein alpha subunit|nr:electron transfer flavoprotein subunit alpha/FixB family protein [Planctomycetota bacterium]MSR39466.1 electron transfer flavoprotein subunit alpha/FixB family protein [Planctomycetota bacterium]GDY03484.1 electron transfer flavoprotein subunit alpha [Planctomycetota bacterium]